MGMPIRRTGVPTREIPWEWAGFGELLDRVARLEAKLEVELGAEIAAEVLKEKEDAEADQQKRLAVLKENLERMDAEKRAADLAAMQRAVEADAKAAPKAKAAKRAPKVEE